MLAVPKELMTGVGAEFFGTEVLREISRQHPVHIDHAGDGRACLGDNRGDGGAGDAHVKAYHADKV